MIGGLISILQPKLVFILLGAITETKNQFINKFKEYSGSFGDYEILDIQKNIIHNKGGYKKLFICSQEWARGKTTAKNKTRLPVDIQKLLNKENDKLIFFDEIHQGSGSNSQQIEMLQEIIFKHSYRAFIMVTATFAKPYLKYMDEGEGHTELIQWRYDDIQMMKEINKVVVNEDTMEEEFIIKEKIKENILLEESGRDKWNVFEKVLEEYLKKGKTLDHLAEEYFIYPRLVVSTPIISDIRENYSDIIVGNNIDIDKIFRPLMGKTLKGSSPCEKFLKYIWSEIYTNFLLRKLNYDIRVPHSEIWFLPTTLRRTKTGGSSDKEESSFRYITQHLVSLMMDNELFKENYCVLILHSVGFDKTEISIIDPKKTGGKPPTWGELNIRSQVHPNVLVLNVYRAMIRKL